MVQTMGILKQSANLCVQARQDAGAQEQRQVTEGIEGSSAILAPIGGERRPLACLRHPETWDKGTRPA